MPRPIVSPPADPFTLPPRIPEAMVLALALYGRATLRARQKAGLMPWHVDRGRDGYVYLRDEVLEALGIKKPAQPASDASSWDFDPDEMREHFARRPRRSVDKAQAAKPPTPPVPEPDITRAETPAGLSLGKYVVLKPTGPGRARIHFSVPSKIRPKGWRAAIPLPLDEPRTGDLASSDEMNRVRSDAEMLYKSMTKERLAQLRQWSVTSGT